MVLCLGTEGSKGYLFRNGWFHCFSVQELKVPKVPYLEMDPSRQGIASNLLATLPSVLFQGSKYTSDGQCCQEGYYTDPWRLLLG